MCEDAGLWDFFVAGPRDRMPVSGGLTRIELDRVLSRIGVITHGAGVLGDYFLRARGFQRAWRGVVEQDKDGDARKEANPRAAVTKKLVH
jgi:hypothetical protein